MVVCARRAREPPEQPESGDGGWIRFAPQMLHTAIGSRAAAGSPRPIRMPNTTRELRCTRPT